MSAIDRMAARLRASPADVAAAVARSNWNEGMRSSIAPVADTLELQRVVALPRRKWEELTDLDWLGAELTDWLKVPAGEQTLRHVQAAALADLHDHRGLFAPMRVGSGKTLVTRLAPLVVAAQKPLLLIPAKLRNKTYSEFRDLNAHWKRHPEYSIVSYQKISHINGAVLLEREQPDMIVMDECHHLKNRRTAVTKRVERYLEANPHVIVVALSGTITKRSIMDFHHILRWTHGPEKMPLPYLADEAYVWARALDPRVDVDNRPQPGALARLLEPGIEINIETAREAFGKRIAETPGIVSTTTAGVDCSLIFDVWDPELPDVVREMIYDMQVSGETKTGDIIQSDVDEARHVREMKCGFYYHWEPPAPLHWLEPRRAWNKFVRETLNEHLPWLDSPLQIERAITAGRLEGHGLLEAWKEVRDQFKPNSVPVWVTFDVLHMIVEKIKELDGPTLVWVEHRAVGYKLEELTGWRYFGEGGLDHNGKPIEEASADETVVLSILANSEGRNLQRWSRNFIVDCPASGQTWEQVLGRSHRDGQEADEVVAVVMIGHSVSRNALDQAFEEARFLQQVQGQPQKLLLADRTSTL